MCKCSNIQIHTWQYIDIKKQQEIHSLKIISTAVYLYHTTKKEWEALEFSVVHCWNWQKLATTWDLQVEEVQPCICPCGDNPQLQSDLVCSNINWHQGHNSNFYVDTIVNETFFICVNPDRLENADNILWKIIQNNVTVSDILQKHNVNPLKYAISKFII